MADSELMLDVGQANELKLAFRRCGWTNEEIKKLSEGDTLVGVRQVIRGEATIQAVEASKLLEDVGTYGVDVVTEFDAETELVEGKHGISWASEEFKKFIAGKIETNVPAARLRVSKLLRQSVDGPIIAELGGEATVETFLAWLSQLLGKLPHGRYLFYVKDAQGRLWVVHCLWYSSYSGWCLNVDSVAKLFQWTVGNQFLSRDS
ncbi:MAG: hypothetical protein WC773_00355 [Patescibacteria group bacterium]|jgi:hypothetical protein